MDKLRRPKYRAAEREKRRTCEGLCRNNSAFPPPAENQRPPANTGSPTERVRAASIRHRLQPSSCCRLQKAARYEHCCCCCCCPRGTPSFKSRLRESSGIHLDARRLDRCCITSLIPPAHISPSYPEQLVKQVVLAGHEGFHRWQQTQIQLSHSVSSHPTKAIKRGCLSAGNYKAEPETETVGPCVSWRSHHCSACCWDSDLVIPAFVTVYLPLKQTIPTQSWAAITANRLISSQAERCE